MITNIAGEEAESPADPNSDLGQMSKKVCFFVLYGFIYTCYQFNHFDCKELLSEHVINI